MVKKDYPKDGVFSVVDYCNCRCALCNIWKNKKNTGNTLPLSIFSNIPTSLKTINLTGGEPFLRKDLKEIFLIIKNRCPSAVISISSNGMLTDRICATVQDLLQIDSRFRIAFSIDGLGELHNTLRGVPNAFQRLESTIDGLKSIGFKGSRFGMVISEKNVDALPEVYDYALMRKIELGFWLAIDSNFYFNKTNIQKPHLTRIQKSIGYVVKKELSTPHIKHWLRAYFAKGLIDHAMQIDSITCTAGSDSFFVNPSGVLYPCLAYNIKGGSLIDSSFDEIWNSNEMDKARTLVAQCKRDCRMICTARADMRKKWYKVIWWIIKNKINRPHF